MVLSGIISVANSIVLWAYFARMREIEDVGRFSIVMGLYSLFYGVCTLGLSPFLISEITRRNEIQSDDSLHNKSECGSFISTVSTILLVSGIICACLMTISGFIVSSSSSVMLAIAILSIAIIPTGLIGVEEASAIASGRTRLIAVATILENLLRTIIPFALIWFGFDIWIICLSFVVVRFAALSIYLISSPRQARFFGFNSDELSKVWKVVPTFASTTILVSINWQVAIVFLGILSSETETAKFGVASRFLIPVSILMASYADVIQPIITSVTTRSVEKTGIYLSKILTLPLIIATSAAILSPFLSRSVLTLFFGIKYADTAQALDILAISVIPFCIVMIVARGLVATNSQPIDLMANAIGVVVCISSCILLIPRYGAIGAAIAQLLSFSAMALFESTLFSRKLARFRISQKVVL